MNQMLLMSPISKSCHEILLIDQANNDAAVSHVSFRNFKLPTSCSDYIHVSWFMSDLVENLKNK